MKLPLLIFEKMCKFNYIQLKVYVKFTLSIYQRERGKGRFTVKIQIRDTIEGEVWAIFYIVVCRDRTRGLRGETDDEVVGVA
jgi:hypothetical protein